MTSITVKQFRALKWKETYSYGTSKKGFKVFGCKLERLAIVHDYKNGKVRISYRAGGRTTDSPTVAVKWYNAAQRPSVGAGQPQATGSAQPPAT